MLQYLLIMKLIKKILFTDIKIGGKDNSLNLLRLVLATLVLIDHAFPLLGIGYGPKPLGTPLGVWAVYGFFCVSGYLIAGSKIKNTFGTFIKHRIFRIFPAYVVVLIITAALFFPIGHYIQHGTLDGLFAQPSPISYVINNANLGLIVRQPMIGDSLFQIPHQDWNGSLWTLQWEFLAYLLIGIILLFKRFRNAATMFAIFAVLTLMQFQSVRLESISEFLRLTPVFFGGALIYMLKDKLRFNGIIAISSLIFMVVCVKLFAITGYNGLALFSPLIVYFMLWFSTMFKFGPLGKLTMKYDISYGVYIYAFPIQQLLVIMYVNNFIPQPQLWLNNIILIIITVIFAILSYKFVEKPALDFGRKKST